MTAMMEREERTDDEIVQKLKDLTGPPPSRNWVMGEFGIGAGRASRLLGLVSPGPARKRSPGRPNKPRRTASPDRTAALANLESDDVTAEWPALVASLGAGPLDPEVEPGPTEDEPDSVASSTARLAPVRRAFDRLAGPHTLTGPEPDDDPSPDRSTRPHRAILIGLYVIAASAGVAIWSGWVRLGELCGYGPVQVLPGIADQVVINAAIALPLGMEAFATIALRVWIGGGYSDRTTRYAKRSTLLALLVGALGQVTYHLLNAAGYKAAPWPVVMFVSILPVAVLGLAAGLAHLVISDRRKGVNR